MFCKPVQQLLAAADRERRDQHTAAVAPGIVENPAQLADGFRAVAMQAVAVGRLHQHQIGLGDLRRIAQDRRAIGAEIAGKHQLPAIAPQLDAGRSEDVAGIAETHLDTREQFDAGVVGNRLDLLHRNAHVVLAVQRHGFGLAAAAIAIGAHRLAFGDAGGVL